MVTRHVLALTRWISSPQIQRYTESGGLELDLDFSKRLIKESKLFLSVCVKSVWYHNCSVVNYSLSDWDQHLPKINNYQIRTKKVVSLFSFQPCYLVYDKYSAGWLWKYISFLRTSLSHRKKKTLSLSVCFQMGGHRQRALQQTQNLVKELKRSVGGREGMTNMTTAALSLCMHVYFWKQYKL